MKIGIDASRAFLNERTGIEEYSYQVIKHLRDKLNGHQVVLYLRKNQEVDFDLPHGWSAKKINCPRLWTQVGLSWEMLFRPVDALFVPAHTVPFIHPEKTAVTIHGLEYEFCPNAYSPWARFYMRWTIRKSCQWAKTIISVSENTKRDLIDLYKVPESKIDVIYEGYDSHQSSVTSHCDIVEIKKDDRLQMTDDKYLLFIGRIEERKNIINIIKAFEILKEKYGIQHKLVLAGKPGHGYRAISNQLSVSSCRDEILELGFVSEEEKWELLKNADLFVFPTFYEGFGIPILEAQSVGCPVLAADNSSIPEVTAGSALLVDPENPEEIAEKAYEILSEKGLRDDIIAKGKENVKRFGWDDCANRIANSLA